MRLYIPHLRDRIKLTEDWTFDLHREGRNTDLLAVAGEEWNYNMPPVPYTMSAGTVLSIDRIYIRNGQRGFDSVTFRDVNRKHRFWAKLDDVNNIVFEAV